MLLDISQAGAYPFSTGPTRVPEWDSLGKHGFSNITGKTLVPTYKPSTPLFSIFGISQSNGINGAPLDPSFVPVDNVDNFNFYDGKVYKAVDPLLGAETTDQVALNNPGSHYLTKLGKLFLQAGIAPRIMLTTISIGGAATTQWMGELKYRIRYALKSLQQEGIPVHCVLQDFGESDNIEGLSAATLTNRINSIVDDFRLNGCLAPYFVAQVAKYQGATNDAQTRLGQANSWSESRRIYQGPDLDTIGNAYRGPDQTHFIATGNTMKAQMWFDTLQAFRISHPGVLI